MAKKKKKKLSMSALAKLKMRLEWYENFALYILEADSTIHDEACDYADELEKK